MRRSPASGIPDGFKLTDSTLDFCAAEFANVNLEATLKIFRDKAEANGWLYSNWQAAFRNYLRNAEKFGGAVYKQGLSADPRWQPVLAEVAPYGFRAPLPHETPTSYRTDFELWKGKQKRSAPVIEFGDALKRMGS